MKYLLIILLLLPIIAKPNIRDTVPTGAAPQLFGGKLYEFRNYVLIDSFLMVMGGDTFAIPRWPALKYKNSDNRWYGYHGTRWRAFLNGTDTISLSNRINSLAASQNLDATLALGGRLTANRSVSMAHKRWELDSAVLRLRGVDSAVIGVDMAKAGTILHVDPPVKFSGYKPYMELMEHVADDVPGEYNNPIKKGFNVNGAFNPSVSGLWWSMEPNYRPGGAKFLETILEVKLPAGSIRNSRLMMSTFVERDSMANSENTWDFRGNTFNIYNLENTIGYFSASRGYLNVHNTTAGNTDLSITNGTDNSIFSLSPGTNILNYSGPMFQVMGNLNAAVQSSVTTERPGIRFIGDGGNTGYVLKYNSGWGSQPHLQGAMAMLAANGTPTETALALKPSGTAWIGDLDAYTSGSQKVNISGTLGMRGIGITSTAPRILVWQADSTVRGIDTANFRTMMGIGSSSATGRWLTKTNDTIYWDIINKRVGWYGVRNANAFGDSYTTFDALNFWRKSWIHIVANTLGFTLHNYAVSGTGVYQTSANANRYIDPATNTAASFIYIGLNEARRGAIASKLFTKYEEGIRTTVVQNLLDSVYYANDASVTQGGTWASRSLTSLGGKAGWYGTNGLLSTGTSNTLTKVITGDKIAVGYIGVDGTNMTGSTFTIDITTPSGGTISRTINPNNRTDGISDGINSNASLSCVAYFTGLGDTTHTVTITTQGADSVYIDYIANLRDAQNVPPVIIQQVPYLNQDGYNYTADPGLNYDNNARTDSMNDVLRTVVNQFTEFPVTLVRTNSYIDTTMLLGDDIHYDSVAHFNMAVATLQNISTSYTASATAAGSTGDVQFKGASGGFDAEGNFNYDKPTNVLSLGTGQLAIGGTPFGSNYKIALTSSGGADNTMVMESKGNDNNSNGFYNIKSKAGNYNLGSGVKMGFSSFNTVMEYGVISNSLTDGSGFSLGDFYYSASGSELMRLNSGGALLIGRNAPQTTEKLRVNGDAYFESNAGNTLISLGGANAAVSTYSAWVKNTGGNTVVSFANYDNNANYPQLYFEKKRGGSYNVNVGDTVGEVSFTNFSGIRGVANTTTDGSFRASDIQFFGADGALAVAERMRMTGVGNFGIGISSPAASLHIKAGTATAGTAPLKLTAGTNLTTPEAGAIEFDGTHYYGTVGSTRHQLDQQLDGNGIYGGSGSLPGDVTVTGGSNGITFTSTRTGTNSTVSINNTSTGRGLTANSTSGVGVHGSSTNSIGILGISTNSTGVWAESSSADALYAQSPYTGGVATLVANPATTNTVHTVLNLTRASTSPGANSIGGSIDFNLNNTFSAGSVTRANQLISQFTTATSGSETSAFTIKGINNGSPTTIAVFDGDGTFTTAGKRIITVTTSAAGTLTLGNSYSYIFNGTTTTWTLPPVSGTNGTIYKLKNIGSGSITLNADSGNNEIYSTSAVNTYAITAGSAIELISNGTYWTVN